jgi:glutathione synthase/RimK-type ligase-like ATP-grasp enzyme
MPTIQPHLGILVSYHYRSEPPFSEKGFFKLLSIYGHKSGISVTVFSPTDILWSQNKIIGYRYHSNLNVWKKGVYPIPSILYDRIFYTNKGQLQRLNPPIQRLVKEKNTILLGRGLPGKWKVYHMYKDVESLQSFLPETMYHNPNQGWQAKLLQYRSLFFKPASGSHGKGVVKASIVQDGIAVQGRTLSNEVFYRKFKGYKSFDIWLRKFIGRRSYIAQPYLELITKNGIPFDLRILIQKNQHGQWEETGRVVRTGKQLGLTSNLHGGGTAVEAKTFLNRHFSQQQVNQINQQLATITSELPQSLEKQHGDLIELGIDIGIDRQGNVWILEANSKPGRKSFHLSKDRKAHLKAILAPLRYTHYVVSHYGGS